MREVNLNASETNIVFTVLNQGDPQRGLTVQEIRTVMPLLDEIEKSIINRKPGPDGAEFVNFGPAKLKLKESDYNFILQKLENSGGWSNAAQGRVVVALIDRFKEISPLPDNDKKPEGDQK